MDRPRAFKRHAHGHTGNWIKQLAAVGLVPEILILEELPVSASNAELNDAEQAHVAYWKLLGCRLTNQTGGGDGMSNPDPEVRARFGWAKGTKQSPEWVKKRTGRLVGRKHSAESRARISASKVGRPAGKPAGWKHTDAAKAKMRVSHAVPRGRAIGGWNHSEAAKRKMSTTKRKLRGHYFATRLNLLGGSGQLATR